jgi:hypothetical protein
MLSAERLTELLAEIFPARTPDGAVELYAAEAEEDERGDLRVSLMLAQFELSGESRLVRDIRQQLVLFVPQAVRDEEEGRVAAFARALVRVLGQALQHPLARTGLPCDLVPAKALMLARAETEEDFVRALSARSRLGRFLQGLQGAGDGAGR